MKIALAIPIYLRGQVANKALSITLAHYAASGVDVHICGSEGKLSKQFAKPFLSNRVKYVEVPQARFCKISAGNDFLRKKFNDSLSTFGKDYDWYCLAGADDIVPHSVFTQLSERTDPVMAGVSMKESLYVWDMFNNMGFQIFLKYAKKLGLLPGINCFNARAMEVSEWKPYQRHGCETGAELYFRDNGKVVALPGHVVMLKEGTVLNSISHILKHHKYRILDRPKVQTVLQYLA